VTPIFHCIFLIYITWLPTGWSLRTFVILLLFKWNHLKCTSIKLLVLTFAILGRLSSFCKVRVPMLGKLSSSASVSNKIINPVNYLTHQNYPDVQWSVIIWQVCRRSWGTNHSFLWITFCCWLLAGTNLCKSFFSTERSQGASRRNLRRLGFWHKCCWLGDFLDYKCGGLWQSWTDVEPLTWSQKSAYHKVRLSLVTHNIT